MTRTIATVPDIYPLEKENNILIAMNDLMKRSKLPIFLFMSLEFVQLKLQINPG
jgi:hypothetical protein